MLVPGALVTHGSVEFLPALDLFLAVDQWKHGAWIDLDVRVPGQFQHAQRVRHFFIAPLVAADDGDTQRLNLRRLQHHQHGLLVGRRRAARILIENHFARLRLRTDAAQCHRNQRTGQIDLATLGLRAQK